jgi:hypothetical protein
MGVAAAAGMVVGVEAAGMGVVAGMAVVDLPVAFTAGAVPFTAGVVAGMAVVARPTSVMGGVVVH